MSVKTNFLAEAKIGKTVEIMIGTKEIRGTVVAVDLDSVQVQRENGQNATVALDMISFYEFGNPEESAGMEQAQSPEGAEKPPTGEAEAAKDRVAVSAAAGEKARPQLVSANDSLLEKLAARGEIFFQNVCAVRARLQRICHGKGRACGSL